jgi:hypothetical protein
LSTAASVSGVVGRDPEGTMEVAGKGGGEANRVSPDLSDGLYVGAP